METNEEILLEELNKMGSFFSVGDEFNEEQLTTIYNAMDRVK